MDKERRTERVAIEESAVVELRQHMWDEDERQKALKGWHIGREIPLALIVVLVGNTIGFIIWAVSLTQEVSFIKETAVAAQIVQTSVDRRQDEETQRAETRIVDRLDKMNAKMDRLIEARLK